MADDDHHRLQASSILAEVNTHVRDLGEHFEVSGGAESVFAFMCECGAAECEQKIVLSLAQFDALKQSDGAVLAAGHELTRAERAMRRSLRLREEAQALGAQAELQTKRARRLHG